LHTTVQDSSLVIMSTTSGTTRGSTRAPRSDATENRETILQAAAAALNDDPDASIEAIAARAGLSRRAVYGHFAGRDELVADVLARGAARIGSSVLPLAHPDPLVEIALFGATLWSEVEHVRVLARFAVRGPHQHRVADALEPARRRLRETIERGAASGAVRTDIDAATVARLVEAAALAVLDEAAQQNITREAGHRLVMLSGLGAAGLGWREADDLIDRTPQLAFTGDSGNPPDPALSGAESHHAPRGIA
jgi:AcrR family transcriptional regulator